MHPKFYEDDVMVSNDDSVEFMRSPFYDLAHREHMSPKQSEELLYEVQKKILHVGEMESFLEPPGPNKDSVAYTRYADKVPLDASEKTKEWLQFPRGQPYRIFNTGAELFKVPKSKEHLEQLKRSKSFLGDKFFGPFEVRDNGVKELLNAKERDDKWKEQMLEAIPRLSHD